MKQKQLLKTKAMKNLNTILKVSTIMLLTSTTLFGQAPSSNYLVKPIHAYTLSANSEESKPEYCYHEKTYTVQRSLNEVWSFYTTVNTKDAWNSKNAKYIMSYDEETQTYDSASATTHDSLKQNKTFLLQLSFLKFVKIPVIFQITKIDAENKIIQFTYMKENKSNGFQTLQFSEMDGQTFIKHTSYYTSGNKFRDNYIYPKFHEVALDDFHSHIFHLLNSKVETKNALAINTINATEN
jgi:hypothetical protein